MDWATAPGSSQGGRVTSPRPIGTPYQLAGDQIREALQDLEVSHDRFAQPPWKRLADATGPLFPGSVWVVGARFGQGKTTFLLHWFSDLFRQQRPVLYIATETPPRRLRRQLAAMHCDLDKRAVLRNQWGDCSPVLTAEEAKANVIEDIKQQESWSEYGAFFHAPRLDRDSLNDAYRAARTLGAGVVLLDHANEYRTGPDSARELAQLASDIVGMAEKLHACVIVAQQVTPWGRDHANPLTEFTQPPLSALRGSQGFAQVAQVALMLHRARRADATAEDIRQVVIGQKQARDLIEPGIMCVSVAKDRDGDQCGRTVRLRVHKTGWLDEDA